ncbi:hypothetical protein [Streptomyces sp. NPDC006739]|uniref:hypothetical protein n=1 Tax=Streptomyces sp. NPDC006739 TaxID=3364763 RepID=UPI003684587A
MRRSTPLVLLLAACAALTACDAGVPGVSTHTAPASDSDLNSTAALPLGRYTFGQDEEKVLDRARWTLGKKCMVGLGFSGFTVFDPGSGPGTALVRPAEPGTIRLPSTDLDLGDRPYGIDDPGQGARTGYHGPASPHDDRQWPLDQYLALTGDLRPGDPKQVHGHPIPEDGCLGQADRRLYGSRPARGKIAGLRMTGYDLTVLRLMRQGNQRALTDPGQRKADAAWSACMKHEGLSYKHPTDAQYRAQWYASDTASAQERRTAEADANCKRSTGYLKAAHAVDVRIEEQLIQQNRTELDGIARRNRAALRTARTITAGRS